MSPPSGTRDEYSRGDGGSRGAEGNRTAATAVPFRSLAAAIWWRPPQRIHYRRSLVAALVLGAAAGAGILVVAEFSTLYSVHVIRGTSTVPPVAAGTENHYAMIPIAVLAAVLVAVALRSGARWALAAVAILGLVALIIGLVHDLPDARRMGLVGSLKTGWVRGASSPGVGMYMETLGAVLLILTAGLGLLFGEPAGDEHAPNAGLDPSPGGA